MPRTTKPKKAQAPQTPDEFLRDAKFRIHARPAKGEPVWERNGSKYTQAQALAVANDEWGRALNALEEMSS